MNTVTSVLHLEAMHSRLFQYKLCKLNMLQFTLLVVHVLSVVDFTRPVVRLDHIVLEVRRRCRPTDVCTILASISSGPSNDL